MNVFGKRLADYVRFQGWILALMLVVGLTRLGLSLAGTPHASARWLSLTGLMLIGLLYYSVRVHTSGFGSYRHLLPLIAIQQIVAESVIIVGIAIAIATGQDNIFSIPEYSPPGGRVDGKSWAHAGGHVVFGVVLASLLAWAVGSAILFLTRKLTPRPDAAPLA